MLYSRRYYSRPVGPWRARAFFSLFFSCLLLLSVCSNALTQQSSESLKEALAKSRDLDKAKIAAELAVKFRQSDAAQALHYAQVALDQLKQTPHPPTRIKVVNTVAAAHLQKREYDLTLKYANQALELAKEFKLPLERANAQNTLGALSWFQGDLESAKVRFESALALRKENNAIDELSVVLNNLGVIEEIQGRYNRAIELYLQAIEYAEKLNNDAQLSRPISNLGVLNQMLRNFDKALEYYQRSLALKLKVNNLVGAAVAHNNISDIYIEKAQYDSALESLQSGLTLLQSVDAPQEKALLLVNSGSAQLYLNKPDRAIQLFGKTQELLDQFNSNEIKIYLAQGYARAYLQKQNYDLALSSAQEFLTLAQAKQDLNSVKKAHHLHYRIYKERGQPALALAAHENFSRIQQDITSKENTDFVVRLQTEFETEKKEKELAILQKQNALQSADIKQQHFLRNVIILSSLLVLAIMFVVYRARSTKIKADLLEKKVDERTQEIRQQNETIAELLQQKEQLLKRKNELFSSVSHEFRTPLTLILGPLKQLFNSTKSSETKRMLNNMNNNAARLLRMVDQLLDLARMDMQAELIRSPVNVSALVNFIVISMETLYEEHKIEVELNLEENIWIEISPEALEKIIVNLLSNAVKYTKEEGKVKVSTGVQGKNALVSVSDTGIGIAEDQHKRVFERFTRLENDFGKPIPGAGVGLALVKELVERYDGEISLESHLNVGSTFTLSFPAIDRPQESEEYNVKSYAACENELNALRPVQISPSQSKEENSDQKKTVLIVEDNIEMRMFLEQSLAHYYHCILAENGQQGVSLAIKEIPDLIVTDLMMPLVTGFELSKTLREEQLTSHIPIIMLTAKGDPESRHSAWRYNIDEYIEKPFDADELLLRCDNILSIRQLVSQRISLQTSTTEEKRLSKTKVNDQSISPRDKEFLEKLSAYLEENFDNNQLNAKQISSALAITEKQLQRKVKALTNDTIPSYVRNFRLRKGADMLGEGISVTHVALDIGFSSQSYFSTAFSARYGCSPSEYQLQKRSPRNDEKLAV